MALHRLTPTALLLAAFALVADPASAQTTRVRGVLAEADAAHVVVRTADGATVTARLAADATIGRRIRADAGAIHPQDYVGVTSVPRAGGDLQAVEVFVFPAAMRGVGEGHRPFDLLPDSTMTNATIAETVDATDGKTLHLTYKGGEKAILLTPETRFFTFATGAPGDLKPGRQVAVSVQPSGDQVVASRITVDDP